MKKCPSSKWCRDLNSWPLEHECPTLTTRPGLPPGANIIWWYLFEARNWRTERFPDSRNRIFQVSKNALAFRAEMPIEVDRVREVLTWNCRSAIHKNFSKFEAGNKRKTTFPVVDVIKLFFEEIKISPKLRNWIKFVLLIEHTLKC